MATTANGYFEPQNNSSNIFSSLKLFVSRRFSSFIDQTILYPKTRWTLFVIFMITFIVRMYILQGFFVVAYALGIYLLNLFIEFLSPQLDPETDTYVLPVRETEEYRPFQRKLPEFKFWLNGFRAILGGLFCTLFRILDVPVLWPILLIYFLMLFIFTIKQQIKNMIQHKYIPFSWGKQTYGDITRNKASTKSPNPFEKRPKIAFASMHSKTPVHTRVD